MILSFQSTKQAIKLIIIVQLSPIPSCFVTILEYHLQIYQKINYSLSLEDKNTVLKLSENNSPNRIDSYNEIEEMHNIESKSVSKELTLDI